MRGRSVRRRRDADCGRRLRPRRRSRAWRPTRSATGAERRAAASRRRRRRCRARRASTSCRGRARRSPSCASVTWPSPRDTPDYHALVAANMVLGGQFVSRINLNLREDKGFTYGARTAFDFRRRPGPFVLQASVQTAAPASAIEESLGEIAGDSRTAAGHRRRARARRRRAHARLRAELRNRRADCARRPAARAVRPARRLLRRVRAARRARHRRRRDRASWPATSIPPA